MVSDDQTDLQLENERLKDKVRDAENELDTARKRLEENNSTNINLEREIDEIFVKFDEEQKNSDIEIYELKKQGAIAYHDFLNQVKDEEEHSSDSDEPDYCGIEPFIKKEHSSQLLACKPELLVEVADAYYRFISHKSTMSILQEETKKQRSEMEEYRRSMMKV